MIVDIVQTLPLVLYALYVSGRYFDATKARALQALMIVAFFSLSAGTYFSCIPSTVLIAMQLGLSIGVMAMAVPMAINAMRVQSGKLRGWIELIVTAIVVSAAFM